MILSGQPTLRYSAARTNIVFDGNSFVAGYGSSNPSKYLPALLAALAPLNGLVNVANTGVSGQKISDMRARGAAYPDAQYVPGKKNVLIALEAYNTIGNGGFTGAQCGDQMAAYCAERLAAHPDWLIVLVGSIATFNGASLGIPTMNAELLNYDNYIKANYRAMGAKRVVDLRTTGIFNFVPGETSMPSRMLPYMSDTIHPNDAGYGLIAQYTANVLKRLPAR